MTNDIEMVDAPPVYVDEADDLPIATLPIHLSTALSPHLSIHQYPLLAALRLPATASPDRRIRARHKPKSGLVELRVPLDTRQEVYNAERGEELGVGREGEDAVGGKEGVGERVGRKRKARKEEEEGAGPKRLEEVRMVSQGGGAKGKSAARTTNMVGVLRGDKLYLHPLERTYQLRPSLDYLDVLSARAKAESRRAREYESDENNEEGGAEGEEGDRKPKMKEAREVLGAAKGAGGDREGLGGLSGVRKDMLIMMRDEREEKWQDLEWNDSNTARAEELYETLFPQNDNKLKCTTKLGDVLRSIKGL